MGKYYIAYCPKCGREMHVELPEAELPRCFICEVVLEEKPK